MKQQKLDYGSFESYPTRFTDTEAWFLINGSWKSIHRAELSETCAVMTEQAFTERFGQVPALPPTACVVGRKPDHVS